MIQVIGYIDSDPYIAIKNIITSNKTRVKWNYYDQFDYLDKSYLPTYCKDIKNMAEQAWCSISRIVRKWYNDHDVYDNTSIHGWANDISSFANWLYKYLDNKLLNKIMNLVTQIYDDSNYDELIKQMTLIIIKELPKLEKNDPVGNILECDGPFEYHDDYCQDHDDYDYYDDEY